MCFKRHIGVLLLVPLFSYLFCIRNPVAYEIIRPYQIAFRRDGKICVMDDYGTNLFQLNKEWGFEQTHAWSPDGSKIVFSTNRDLYFEIYVTNVSGTILQRLTNEWWANSHSPCWSPDGSRIVYVSNKDGYPKIYIMDSDGQNNKRLTDNSVKESDPHWSPDGSKIAFVGFEYSCYEIFIVNPDGSHLKKITHNEE
ncbi:MAG: DPP IV N-terminal domain-containing protein, partial [bacterium]